MRTTTRITLLAALILLVAAAAEARVKFGLKWTLPTTDVEGNPVASTDLGTLIVICNSEFDSNLKCPTGLKRVDTSAGVSEFTVEDYAVSSGIGKVCVFVMAYHIDYRDQSMSQASNVACLNYIDFKISQPTNLLLQWE